MKTYRVISTDTATWRGTGTEYQDRWLAEDEYAKAKGPGKMVTLAEFVDGRQTEIIRSSQLEDGERKV